MGARVRIGTSGWVYPHWRGRFYPKALPTSQWLAFYAQRFDTVELNNSFIANRRASSSCAGAARCLRTSRTR